MIEKRMAEINNRKLEIRKSLNENADIDLEAIQKELDELEAETRNLNGKLEIANKINEGKIEAKAVEVPIKEERKMEFKIDSLEYRNAYLSNLQGKELTVEERAAISAQNVIPTQTVNKIIEKLEQTSALYNRITVTNFPNKLSFPVENAKNDASWIAISAASTDSADTFDTVSLGANKLIKTIEIEADVMAMSIDAFESFIVNALAKKMSKAIENAILNGTGTNQPTGLLKAGEITQAGTFTKTAMAYKDLCKMLGDLPTMYHNNACVVIPRALFFTEILGMQTTSGEPVCVVDPQSPARYNILGYQVIVNDYMAADTIIFGDLSYYYFNWAKNVEISKDMSVAFRSGSTVYRALALADGKKALAEAFVKYTRTTA